MIFFLIMLQTNYDKFTVCKDLHFSKKSYGFWFNEIFTKNYDKNKKLVFPSKFYFIAVI